MGVYDGVKMSELLAVKEEGDLMVLSFQGGVRITIRASGGKLASEMDG